MNYTQVVSFPKVSLMTSYGFIFILLLNVWLYGSDDYTNSADSYRQPGVPLGAIFEGEWTNSQIYPDMYRKYWIYVPAQYDGKTPINLMIFQDGENWVKTNGSIRATYVLDNLIEQKALPVTAGLFINPGRKMPVADPKKKPENRGLEYDSVTNGSKYPEFLIKEMFPLLEAKVKITTNPEGRGLAGSSSGGIAAFTACWLRPDQFRKVYSCVGSFVDLRGGHNYPPMIRKSKNSPKPIRMYFMDGTNDLDNDYGNWPLAAQEMAAALKFAGYDYQFLLGDGAHNSKMGAAYLPEGLKWLWREGK